MIGFDGLEAGALVVIDSAPIIYLLEGHPAFGPRFEPLFHRLREGRLRAVVSPVTIAEVTAGPLSHGDEILAERYYHALTSGPNLRIQEVTAEVAFRAARIRGRYRLKLPDAIRLATALHVGASALVTHDRDFGGIEEIAIIGL